MKVLLIGGIGAGKSTVAKLFAALGVPVYFVDDENRKMMQREDVQQKYFEVFGQNCFDENGKFKKELLPLFYNDKEKKAEIESYMSKVLGEHMESWYNDHSKNGATYVLVECAVAIEIGITHNYDYVIVVHCPVEIRKQRVIKRDGKTEAEFEMVNSKQATDAERLSVARFVINSAGPKGDLDSQVLKIHDTLLHLSKTK